MTVATKTHAMLQKAVALVSAPFRLDNPDSWRAATLNKDSGEVVNEDTALQLSAVFACVRLIAETVATLPLIVYQRKNGGGRKVAIDHPLYGLLHDSPNADQTAVEFWEVVIACIALRGRAYVHKDVDVAGNIFGLTPLHPDRMGLPRLQQNGTYVYPYNHPTRGLVEYTEAQLWVPRGFAGLSVIQYGARSMGSAISTEKASAKFFGRDMKPNAVITRDEFLTRDQRAQWKSAVEDGMLTTTAGGAIRLLEGGLKYQQLSLSAEDAQLIETRGYSVEDLCRWFNVPPSMIGHGGAVSNWGTGREQINLGFLQYVLRAYTKRIEQGITKHLLRPEERRRIYAEFSVEGLLRADSAGRASFYSTMVQNGLMTRNEVRELENMDALPGGDDLTIQSNLVPATLLGNGTTDADDAIDALKRALGVSTKPEGQPHEA